MDSGGGVGGERNPYAFRGGAPPAAWAQLVGGGAEEETAAAGTGGYGHFLEACFLCRKPLAGNRDIYMYRGDTPFCSEECRREQMEMDEEMERKEHATPKKVALRAPPPIEVDAPPKPNKVRAGSILAG